MENNQKAIVICEDHNVIIKSVHYESGNYHGTGDVFDAVVLGGYLNGKPINECIQQAHTFVCTCIQESSCYDYSKQEGLLIEKFLTELV